MLIYVAATLMRFEPISVYTEPTSIILEALSYLLSRALFTVDKNLLKFENTLVEIWSKFQRNSENHLSSITRK